MKPFAQVLLALLDRLAVADLQQIHHDAAHRFRLTRRIQLQPLQRAAGGHHLATAQ